MLEIEIVEAILKYEDKKISKKLYEQFKVAEVKEREYTGTGFFTYFYINDNTKDIFLSNGNMQLGGIHAEIKGLKNGAGFVLYVENGRLKALEGYSYNETWPNQAQISNVFVVKEDGTLIEN